MIIKNRDKLVEEMSEMLLRFDEECNNYHTDVYFYYDDETQTATLDTFVNVGGNSWLDDDHITIYTDNPHYDDGAYSWYQSEQEFADTLGISLEQLYSETRAYHKLDDDEEVEYYEIERYIQNNEEYDDKITESYSEHLKQNFADEYASRAEEIISDVEDIVYFSSVDGYEGCLIMQVGGNSEEIKRLNEYAEKYTEKHKVELENLKEHLIDEEILEFNRRYGGYDINMDKLSDYANKLNTETDDYDYEDEQDRGR